MTEPTINPTASSTAILDALEDVAEGLTVAQKLTLLHPIETRLERALAKAFRTQRIEFTTRLRRHRAQFAVPVRESYLREAASEETWGPALDAAFTATSTAMVVAIDTGARQSMAQGIRVATTDLVAPDGVRPEREAVRILKNRGADRVTAINDVTRARTRAVLVQAMEEGWPYTRTEQALTQLFAGFSVPVPQKHLGIGTATQIGTRARLIAVTESATAYEEGRRIVAGQMVALGVAMEKRWITAPSERVCATCNGAAGQGWIPFADAFHNGFAGPPGHPACRCSGDERVVT